MREMLARMSNSLRAEQEEKKLRAEWHRSLVESYDLDLSHKAKMSQMERDAILREAPNEIDGLGRYIKDHTSRQAHLQERVQQRENKLGADFASPKTLAQDRIINADRTLLTYADKEAKMQRARLQRKTIALYNKQVFDGQGKRPLNKSMDKVPRFEETGNLNLRSFEGLNNPNMQAQIKMKKNSQRTYKELLDAQIEQQQRFLAEKDDRNMSQNERTVNNESQLAILSVPGMI